MPTGYGRMRAREAARCGASSSSKDADDAPSAAIREVNTGIMGAPAGALGAWLAGCATTTRSGEYYLTDIIAMRGGRRRRGATAVATPSRARSLGVNGEAQLAELERVRQRARAQSDCWTPA
jgi:bifunctional UDP-N-acetylglucosamine pyrophosphorylase/glucosamine-1-phosphate N-acetyltransferase